MPVARNVGIPLGIVVVPTDRSTVFEIFARQFVKQGGMSSEAFARLALLSDQVTALARYAALLHHQRHFLCLRHLLDILGSGTLVALLEGRIMFTVTEASFNASISQMRSDFTFGSHDGVTTEEGRKEGRKLLKFLDLTLRTGI
jgi:hypothetical protein